MIGFNSPVAPKSNGMKAGRPSETQGGHICFLVGSLEKMGRKAELSSDSAVLDFWGNSPGLSGISAVSTSRSDSKHRTRRL